MFAAIATVGVLGSAILSTVLSVSDVDFLGFSFKEILRFNKSTVQIQSMLIFSIGSIILAMVMLSFEYCTTMSLILVYSVCNIIYCSQKTWKIISDKGALETLVKHEVMTIIKEGSVKDVANKVEQWSTNL